MITVPDPTERCHVMWDSNPDLSESCRCVKSKILIGVNEKSLERSARRAPSTFQLAPNNRRLAPKRKESPRFGYGQLLWARETSTKPEVVAVELQGGLWKIVKEGPSFHSGFASAAATATSTNNKKVSCTANLKFILETSWWSVEDSSDVRRRLYRPVITWGLWHWHVFCYCW